MAWRDRAMRPYYEATPVVSGVLGAYFLDVVWYVHSWVCLSSMISTKKTNSLLVS